MKKSILVCLLCFLSFSVLAIEVTLNNSYPGPSRKKFKALGYEERWDSLGYSSVVWCSNESLILEANPYFWRLNLDLGEYEFASDLYTVVGQKHRFMAPFRGNNFIVMEYGSVSETRFGLYNDQYGWKEIEEKRDVITKLRRSVISNDKMNGSGIVDYVLVLLLGHYGLVPRPEITDFSERQLMDVQTIISLKNLQTGELIYLPRELYSVRSPGLMTAVSFDRFKIAMIGILVQETKESSLHFDERIYILDVVYDGLTSCETIMKVESPEQGERIEVLPENTKLLVTGTTTYEILGNDTEDYWYRVTVNGLEGIVFGGDLLIEGDDWTVRLKDRGRPIEWDELDSYLSEISKTSKTVEAEPAKINNVEIQKTVNQKEEIAEIKNDWTTLLDQHKRLLVLLISILGIVFAVIVVVRLGRKR